MTGEKNDRREVPDRAAEMRRKAEEKIKAIEHSASAEVFPEVIQRTFHELKVHQIELELQNEELRRTQEELTIARELYFDLYNLAPVGYVKISESGLMLESNLTAATLLGANRGALVKQPVSRFIFSPDQDIYYHFRKQLFSKGEPQACELRMVKSNGEMFWARLNATLAHERDDSPVSRVVIVDITDRKLAEEAVKRQLGEKELILKEVHHRIKNNLLSISGLLKLQAATISSGDAVKALEDAVARIESMRVVYDKLLAANNFGELSIKDYLEDLIPSILNIFSDNNNIALRMNIDDFKLNAKTVFPLGTIVNELITNSMKYAFPDGTGVIDISVKKTDNEVRLSVRDSGGGLPENFEAGKSGGFGLTLVDMLSRQLNGTFEREEGRGAKCVVRFTL